MQRGHAISERRRRSGSSRRKALRSVDYSAAPIDNRRVDRQASGGGGARTRRARSPRRCRRRRRARRRAPDIVMPISWPAISIVILLWEMNTNCVSAAIAVHHPAEAAGVGIVERRVDLVQQAERRRIQLEQREHERDGGERLLAAGQQVDRRVALARRLRDDLHAGIEDFLAGEHEPRLTAAEERREELGEILVDRFERLLQELRAIRGRSGGSRFRASPSPRSGRPPARRGTACARCAISSSSSAARLTAPRLGDRRLQPLDLAGERRLVAERLQRVGQPGDLGIGLGELQRELLLRERGGLLLEPHLLDLRARGIELLHRRRAALHRPREARRRALPGGRVPPPAPARPRRARASWRCSASSTGVQSMAARSERELGQAGPAAGRPAPPAPRAAARAPRGGRGSCARRTPLPAPRARRAARARARAPARPRASLRACRAASRFDHLLVQRRLRVGELRRRVARARSCSAASSAAISDSSSRDLRAALCGRLGGLPELQELELEIVAAPLLRRERHALGVPGVLRASRGRASIAASASRAASAVARAPVIGMRQLGQLALAREHAVELAVGREEVHRLRRDEMPLRRDEGLADAERRHARASACGDARRGNARRAASRPGAARARPRTARTLASSASLVRGGRGPRRRPARRPRSDPAARRHRRRTRRHRVEALELDRVEPLAQYRLERVLPAGLDVESLPQARAPCARPRSSCHLVVSLPWPILACSAASACARASRSARRRPVCCARVAGARAGVPADPGPMSRSASSAASFAAELARSPARAAPRPRQSGPVTGAARPAARLRGARAAARAARARARDARGASRSTRIACSPCAIRSCELGGDGGGLLQRLVERRQRGGCRLLVGGRRSRAPPAPPRSAASAALRVAGERALLSAKAPRAARSAAPPAARSASRIRARTRAAARGASPRHSPRSSPPAFRAARRPRRSGRRAAPPASPRPRARRPAGSRRRRRDSRSPRRAARAPRRRPAASRTTAGAAPASSVPRARDIRSRSCACASSFSSWLASSMRMSSTRERLSRVSARRPSVSLRRSLYFETPAASSRKTRSSSGFASMTREIIPCSMIA